MSAQLWVEFQASEKRSNALAEKISLLEEKMSDIMVELDRLKTEKRPDRPPIRVPKMPSILKSIGVGLAKE